MRKEKSLFIRKNTPELINELTQMGYSMNALCREGIYIGIEHRQITLLNHVPYPKHIDFNDNETRFLIAAKCLFNRQQPAIINPRAARVIAA